MELPQRVEDFSVIVTPTAHKQIFEAKVEGTIATAAVIVSALMIIRMTGPYRYIGGALGIGGLGLGYDLLINRMPQLRRIVTKLREKKTAFREVFNPSNEPKLQQELVDYDFAKSANEYIKKHPDWKTKSVQDLFNDIDPTITGRLNQLADLLIMLHEPRAVHGYRYAVYCPLSSVHSKLRKMKKDQEPFIYPVLELVEDLKETESGGYGFKKRYRFRMGTDAARLAYDVPKIKEGWMDYSPVQWAFILSQPAVTQFICSSNYPADSDCYRFRGAAIKIMNNLRESEQCHRTRREKKITTILTAIRYMFWLDEQT